MLKIVLFAPVAFLIFSCKSAVPIYRETRIVDTILSAAPPVIHDTLTAYVTDTVVSADRVVAGDTVIKIRYYPRKKTLTVYVKPDTVRLKYRDTTTSFKEGTSPPGGGVGWEVWVVVGLVVFFGVVKFFNLRFPRSGGAT